MTDIQIALYCGAAIWAFAAFIIIGSIIFRKILIYFKKKRINKILNRRSNVLSFREKARRNRHNRHINREVYSRV